jgi:ankyrin repeat protein
MNMRWYNKGLLQEAIDSALLGDMQKMEKVVDLKISLDLEIENGFTPLETAAEAGNIKLVEFLLQAGADPNIRWPLLVAAFRGCQDIYDLLFPLVSGEAQIDASEELSRGLIRRYKSETDPNYMWDD